MASFEAIFAVGTSIVAHLRNAYEQQRMDEGLPDCIFDLISSSELARDDDRLSSVTLYLYRVSVNEHLRNRPPVQHTGVYETPLSLDLHYLLTVWANESSQEQRLLGWAMRHLHSNPVLDVSSLSSLGDWQPNDVLHLVPAELSNEDLMRIWDALTPSYRLSFSYVARVVRIDPYHYESRRSVVATRFEVGDEGLVPAGEARP